MGNRPANPASSSSSTSRPAESATATIRSNSATRASVLAMRMLPVWRQSIGQGDSRWKRLNSSTEAMASLVRSALVRTWPTNPAAWPDVAPGQLARLDQLEVAVAGLGQVVEHRRADGPAARRW